MWRKLLTLGMVSLGLSLGPGAAVAAPDDSDPYRLAEGVATQTLSEMQAHAAELQDPAFCARLIDEQMMPYVDLKYAAYKIIGAQLKQTTPADREAFTAAFAGYLKQTFADALRKYTNQTIVPVGGAAIKADQDIVPVKLLVREEGKPDITVIIKTRRNGKTGKWKAFDLIAENVSILDAKQAELSPIIREQGIAAAIEALRQHTVAP